MTIVWAIDLDGTLAKKGKPIKKNVEKCNKLADKKNNLVIIYTARPEWTRERTEEYLKILGVKYHLLVMGKLMADHYVDDRMMSFKEFQNGKF